MEKFLAWAAMIPDLVMLITGLVKEVEENYEAAKIEKSGATKKAIVMETIRKVVNDDGVWEARQSFVSWLVNLLSKMFVGASGHDPQ